MDVFPSIGDYASGDLSFYDQYDIVIQKNNFWKPLSILQNPSLRLTHPVLLSFEPHILAGCMLNYLLVPVRDIQERVQQMKSYALIEGKPLLAIHVRSGDSQSKNASVVDELIQTYHSCVDEVCKGNADFHKVFLSTDSDDVRERLHRVYPDLLEFPGPIAHVDGFF